MQHITKRALVSPWFVYLFPICMVFLVPFFTGTTGIDRIWRLLIVALCVCAVYGVYILVFLRGDAILTAEGVELTNLIRRKKIPWTDIIQAVSVNDGKLRFLMLVRKNSRHIKPGTINPNRKWEYRNAIYLLDEEDTRTFLQTHFGPVELEL